MWAGQPGLGQFCQAALLTPNGLANSSLPLGLDLMGPMWRQSLPESRALCWADGRDAENLCTGPTHSPRPERPLLPTEQSGWEPVLGREAGAVVPERHLLPSPCTNVPDPRAQDPSITVGAFSWHHSLAPQRSPWEGAGERMHAWAAEDLNRGPTSPCPCPSVHSGHWPVL